MQSVSSKADQVPPAAKTSNSNNIISEMDGHNSNNLSTASDTEGFSIGKEYDSEIEPSQLDWDDKYDMDNPHNWSAWKKWSTVMVAAFLALVVTMGSSSYMSAVPEFVTRYKVDRTLAISGLTFYLLGLANVVGAPLSEVYGRKPVYLYSLPISLLFALGVGFSDGKMRIVLPLRFLSGVFASPALSVASGTIADIFDMDELSVLMTFFCLAPFLGPVISPIMTGYAVENKDWRWAIWIQLLAGAAIFPFIVIMPETNKTIILQKRAKKRGLNVRKPSAEELRAFLKATFTTTIFRPLKMLMVEPIVFVFSLYVSFVFAVLFAFFESYPLIFRQLYHFSMGNYGLTFLGISVGLWIGSAFYIWYDRRYLFPKAPAGTPPLDLPTSSRTTPFRGHRDENGNIVPLKPESIMFVAKVGSVALPAALFWIGWSAKPSVHWMVPLAAGVPFGFSLVLIFFSVLMYFTMSYPPLVVASAMAANNMMRYVFSCTFPLFTIQMYEKLGIDWASSVFAFISLAMVPVPWLFSKYGERLRKRSVFGYHAMHAKPADPTVDVEKENEHQEAARV
ncbi:HBL321Wp [Eremothecium sinecaudum]|uniref:HBL321Wp n=1 Tax=Eremothecium sinecaudum TaxID=45286 RepID=A0A109UVY5_9SACH|nr:HBL321Wp [Eremothecium sinecaudum]AMD18581.1 HBL321Wp [Eremothecium sinecaudum]